MNRILTCLALAGTAWIFAPAAQAASFDCTNPAPLAPDERTICATPDLNEADVKMTTMYDLISGLFAMGTRGDMADRQKQWLEQRATCGEDVACLRAAYDQRIRQLQEIYAQIPKPL